MTGMPPPVPSKDYARQYAALLPTLLPELERVLLEEAPVLGASVDAFEREFADYVGTRFAIGVNSGTDALVLALRALGVGPGDEVIVPANTFIATIHAVVLVGARPVLVDPDEATMLLAADAIDRARTRATRAVIAVHLYGALAPMDAIRTACERAGLALLEDAAQSHGARAHGATGACAAGAFGDAGCFSFHPSKNLGAFGDAGIVTTSDERLAADLRSRRNLGKASKYDVRVVAPNTKLDTIQAAVLRIKLRTLDAANARRRAIAGTYRDALADVGDLVLPTAPSPEAHVFHLYVVRTAERDALKKHLARRGIRASLHYPIAPHRQPLDVDLGYAPGSLPITERLADSVLSLPVSPELTDAEIERVCAAVRSFYDG